MGTNKEFVKKTGVRNGMGRPESPRIKKILNKTGRPGEFDYL